MTMTLETYQAKMASLIMVEAFDAIYVLRNNPDCCPFKILRMHWEVTNGVLRCESVGEVRDLLWNEGFNFLSQLHKLNIEEEIQAWLRFPLDTLK